MTKLTPEEIEDRKTINACMNPWWKAVLRFFVPSI